MTTHRRFALCLAVAVVAYLAYGFHRFSLGVDFTDEGAYVAWPLRTLFGEPAFAGDPLLALRPLFNHLSALYRIHPGVSLYELRLLGWAVHLGAFSIFAFCLFRLSGAAVPSVLLASVPLFVCHIFGLAPPSYNSFSSDFLLTALCLLALAAGAGRRQIPLEIAAAGSLFMATLAHPALGVVAAALGLHAIIRERLIPNLLRLRPSAANIGILVFGGCWILYFAYLLGSGAIAVWLERTTLYPAARLDALDRNPGRFYWTLFRYPFCFDVVEATFACAAIAVTVAMAVLGACGRFAAAANAAAGVALILLLALLRTIGLDADLLPATFGMASLVASAGHFLAPGAAAPGVGRLRLLVGLSVLGAVLQATTTYYFTPQRSWTSGILGLPFAFGIGLSFLLPLASDRWARLRRMLVLATLAVVVAGLALNHHHAIYRDGYPAQLTATFRNPKFRHLRSTPERTQSVDALYAYLRPRLSRGEAFLAYDDCPMLYFLFDVRPVYGLTWAARYVHSPAVLARLDAEFRSHPLPHYAVRTLVDLSHPTWADAPRTSYANYPLDATVTSHYELERTLFPFEIWRLKETSATVPPPAASKKASP